MECQKQDVDWSALVIFRSDSFNDQASDCNRDGLGLKINGPGAYKAHYNPPQIIAYYNIAQSIGGCLNLSHMIQLLSSMVSDDLMCPFL